MTESKLRLVSFGSAKALTRDMLTGAYIELKVNDSFLPPVG